MRIAFVGKGGSGKTTLCALTAHAIASHGPVLAIDADINQHLAQTLGLPQQESAALPALGLEMKRIKEYLRGTNTHIPRAELMIKTTPPGTGSRLLRIAEHNPLYEYFARPIPTQGAYLFRLMAVGPFDESDLGERCYHSKTGAVELLLNHLKDTAGEYCLVDMTAGADSFASGLFTRFDLTILVVEPTHKSLTVYHQYKQYAKDYDVTIRVVGNQVHSAEDEAFIRAHVGSDLIGYIPHLPELRTIERGGLPYSTLAAIAKAEPIAATLRTLRETADLVPKNWGKFYAQAALFHMKNARSWANAEFGQDLSKQIDQDFIREQH